MDSDERVIHVGYISVVLLMGVLLYWSFCLLAWSYIHNVAPVWLITLAFLFPCFLPFLLMYLLSRVYLHPLPKATESKIGIVVINPDLRGRVYPILAPHRNQV
mgnify:CR=1 FL=1